IYEGKTVDWPKEIVDELTHAGKFEKMVNVTGIITFGCNIPLFVIGNDPIEAIEFPHRNLSDELKSKAEWHNYYDPDDVLGFPLKELKYSYDGLEKPPNVYSYPDVVMEDVPIQVGNFLIGGTPKSHTSYWGDNKFVEPVAKYIRRFL
ncbi:hypothetical protein IIA15_11020, partial [candidate division TA06 bacterium]|nr:hypothetical protein [candidate division TA06 bacterium]